MTTYPANMENADGSIRIGGEIEFTSATNQPQNTANPIASGTLPQLTSWVSTTAKQNPVARPITIELELVFDGTANAATVAIAISPNNSDYTTLATPGVSSAINTVGAQTFACSVPLPTGWYIKLTFGAHVAPSQSYYY